MFKKNNIRLFVRYLHYLLFSHHKKGHGIHSPFVYDFITKVLRNKKVEDEFIIIKDQYKRFRSSHQVIHSSTFGAGSRLLNIIYDNISNLVKRTSIPVKYGRLLFNLVRNYNISSVLELGTSTGMSGLYLGLANRKIKVITIEGNPELAEIARTNFSALSLDNIEVINERFENVLTESLCKMTHPFLVFIDGDHSYDATVRYFNQILPLISVQDILVLDDINWSKSMEEAWNEIKKCTQVTLTIDLFRLGIIFFNKNLRKQDYILKF